MKKTVATAIIISLVMCLTMSFPASAAKTHIDSSVMVTMIKKYKMDFDKRVGFFSSVPSGYNYIMFYLTQDDSPYMRFIVSDSPVLQANTKFYRGFINVLNEESVTIANGNWGVNQYFIVKNYTHLQFPDSQRNHAVQIVHTDSKGVSTGHNVFISGVIVNYSNMNLDKTSPIYQAVLGGLTDIDVSLISESDLLIFQALISQAKAKENTGYTQSSWQALQTQITAAENLLLTTGYTQEQMDNAKNALQTALNGLILLPDTSELDILVLEADEIKNDGYSNTTWNIFTIALTNARLLLLSGEYTVNQINAVKAELQASMNNLRLLPDSSALESLILQAQTYIDDKYTELSQQILNNKIMQALILLEDKDYVNAQIENMISELTAAIIGLVLNQSPDPPIIVDPPTKPPVIIVEGSRWYSLIGEQKKYADLTGGITPEHLEPIKDAVVDNIQVARKFGLWAYIITLLPLVTIMIIVNFVRKGDDDYVSIDMSAPSLNGRHISGKPDRQRLGR